MVTVIASIIQSIIVPGIMLVLLIFALRIASAVSEPELKVSAWSGFWAGLVLFVVYVISNLNVISDPKFNFSSLPGLLIIPMGFGFAVGFIFLWMVRAMLPTRLVGFITLALSAISTSAFFTYIFIESLRFSVLYWTLGTALGILLHTILFPASIREIFS